MTTAPLPTTREVPLRHTASWAAASATLAPVVLVLGWWYAGALASGYDRVAHPLSDLWASDAPNRWVMAVAVGLVGACHVVTATGLRPVDPTGRWLLAVGGGFMMLWAATPNHVAGRYFLGHTFSGGLTFFCLALWAAVSARNGPHVPAVLHRPVAAAVSIVAVLLLLTMVFGILGDTADQGLREGALLLWTALWPLVVVIGCRRPGSMAQPDRGGR
ncbi:MAG: DUF998 domain-containing protein [Dermatophilaceae bacterium]